LYIYGALFVAAYILRRAWGSPAGSLNRRERYQQLVFLVLLWYSPLIQNAASMQGCEYDPDIGLVLTSDARVSCEPSLLRTATIIHAFAVFGVIGVGLPVFVLWKSMQLRKLDKLNAESPFAGLFEWYSISRPYWESVLLIKKFCLVLAADTFVTSPLVQALLGIAINATYLVHFEMKRPMPYLPTSVTWFNESNFFHLIERSSAVTNIIGSLLAFLGTFSKAFATIVGTMFAIVNFTFVAAIIAAFAKGRVKSGGPAIVMMTTFVDWEKGWKEQIKIIDETENLKPESKTQMIDELDLFKGKLMTDIEKNMAELVSRKYKVTSELASGGINLTASSSCGSKILAMAKVGSIITATGTRTVLGSSRLLTKSGWASIHNDDGKIALVAVTEIDMGALLEGVRKAESVVDLMNFDSSRLKPSSKPIVFQEFLKKIYVAEIVEAAEKKAAEKEKKRWEKDRETSTKRNRLFSEKVNKRTGVYNTVDSLASVRHAIPGPPTPMSLSDAIPAPPLGPDAIPGPPTSLSYAVPAPPPGPPPAIPYAREIEMKEMYMNPMRKGEGNV
jgi:hypothetical protein